MFSYDSKDDWQWDALGIGCGAVIAAVLALALLGGLRALFS